MKRPAPLIVDEEVQGPDRIVVLRGSADMLCLPVLQKLFFGYAKEKIRLLVIDLSATDFINSPVWAVITLFARKHKATTQVAVVGMSDHVRGSFEMMGLHNELQTPGTLEEARAEFGSRE